MIVEDVEFTFVDHDDHMDLLVTQDHRTILVPMKIGEIDQMINKLVDMRNGIEGGTPDAA